jgi:ectoine hydroxylase-related dioxygenase (phytanoyl-CoA dioxygenase family)
MMRRALSEDQVSLYHEEGLLFPIPALSANTLARYRASFEEVYDGLIGDHRPERFGQWQLCFRWAYDLATQAMVLDAVEDILGPNILVHSATAFVKSPHSPKFVSWHQDGFYWGLDAPRLVSAWIALSDSTPESGCLRVIRGSHRRARIEHVVNQQEHNMLASGLNAAVEFDEALVADVCLRAGEMSFHHVDAVHGSGPNRSEYPRIGFAIRYTTPDVSQGRCHHEVILARGEDNRHHFRHLREPPGGSISEGLLAQQALRVH